MPRRDRLSFICLAPLALSLSIWAAEADAEQTKFFEMKIRPLLINHCFDCHAEKKQKGALRLDSIQAILKGGQTGPALVPGKPETSLLITAVSGKDEDLVMPPKEKLSAAEVVRSAGASRAHKALDRVAVQKLSECKFSPGLDDNGRAVGGSFEVEYVWKLAG